MVKGGDNINLITCTKDEIWSLFLQKLIRHPHFTKSLKHDNIYKLCLWMLGRRLFALY